MRRTVTLVSGPVDGTWTLLDRRGRRWRACYPLDPALPPELVAHYRCCRVTDAASLDALLAA